MSRRRGFPKKDLPPLPSQFALHKYDFKDDYKIWFAALALRFELKQKVDAFLAWKPEGEFSERQLALHRAVRKDLQDKVLSLMDRPIPLISDSSDHPTPVNQLHAQSEVRKDQVPRLCARPKAVSDRLVIDEFRSANKLQDEGYKKLFEREIENLTRKRDSLLSSNPFGIPLRREFRESRKIEETANFKATYSMWRADIQMPNFSGEFGLKVNLFHDDKMLIEEFKEWLKATRSAVVPGFGKQKGVTADTLQAWVGNKLIPYLDLWLYQQAFGVTLPFPEIGALLYEKPYNPNEREDDGGDWTKKARDTHKRAMEITNPLSFFALRNNI